MLACASESNLVKDVDVTTDDGRRANDDTRSMIHHHARAYLGCGVNVDTEQLRAHGLKLKGLQPICSCIPCPKCVCDAVQAEGMKPLKEEDRLQQTLTGWIRLHDLVEIAHEAAKERWG
eukprot:scaffold159527_cov44-Tisochrysis_lutea.AAC.1